MAGNAGVAALLLHGMSPVAGATPDGAAVRPLAFALPPGAADPVSYGPPPDSPAPPPVPRYAGFGGRVAAVWWETALIAGIITVAQVARTSGNTSSFHFQDEGWFGKDTYTLGIDKLSHSFDTYVFSDILYARMKRKTGGGLPSAITAATLGFGLQLYGEAFDGFKRTSGFSGQDVLFNGIGAGFSVLRNAVPGLKEKIDFRIQVTPDRHVYSIHGAEHYRQESFLVALKLAGFRAFGHGPLRLLELQAGYHATGFTPRERARGEPLRRRPFLGIGLNLNALFFPDRPRSWAGRAASTVLDYVQVPYTAVRIH